MSCAKLEHITQISSSITDWGSDPTMNSAQTKKQEKENRLFIIFSNVKLIVFNSLVILPYRGTMIEKFNLMIKMRRVLISYRSTFNRLYSYIGIDSRAFSIEHQMEMHEYDSINRKHSACCMLVHPAQSFFINCHHNIRGTTSIRATYLCVHVRLKNPKHSLTIK